MIGFSPRGIIDLLFVFPVMFIIALVLDILTILLSLTIIGGIILAVIGALTVGLWIFIRSGKQKEPGKKKEEEKQEAPGKTKTVSREGEEVAAREGAETAGKTGIKTAAREGTGVASKTAGKSLGRIALRLGIATGLKAIPVINIISSIVFGWTVMVIWEFVSDFKSFSLEAGD